MATPKGGRPKIGQQVTVTLPAEILAAVDEAATREGTTRADVLRATITDAFRPQETDMSDLLAPAVAILADWIAADRARSRERFVAYKTIAGRGMPLVDLLMRAAGELLTAGAVVAAPAPEVAEALTARVWQGRPGWQIRGDLFFAVMAELGRRDVRLMGPVADGEDAPPGFDPPEDEEYA